MGRIKRHLRSAAGYLAVCAKWLVLAALVGCLVGPLGAAFGLALNWANATRAVHPWLLYLLPAAGLVIVFLYNHFDPDGGGSTNQVFVAVREHKPLTLRTAPLIFFSTVVTHLFGGSSGREGAALLLGGSVSGQVGRALHLENRDCRLMTMCGMAGAFSAIFGTPLAATIFTLEVVDVGSMQYAALLPCLVSALLGVFFSGQMGLSPEAFVLKAEVAATPPNLVRVIILGALLAALSIFFCELLHAAPRVYAKLLPNPYLRVAVGGVLIAALTTLLGTTDYNGAGGAVIEAAMDGEAVPYAFLLKMLFTALTLGAGFKGGEIVPIFFTGATFGWLPRPCWVCRRSWGPRWVWWRCSAAAPTARWRPSVWPSRYSAGSASRCLRWRARFPICCPAISASTGSSTSCTPSCALWVCSGYTATGPRRTPNISTQTMTAKISKAHTVAFIP